jgi:hypothetical protein
MFPHFTIRDSFGYTFVAALATGIWLRLPMAYVIGWLIVLVVVSAIIFVLFSWPH